MKRKLYEKLLEWKTDSRRKPLLLRGARQVGKTHLLKQFGKAEYTNMIYLDFDSDPALNRFFTQNLDPQRIVRDLSLKFGQIEPEKTLLVFDECQESPRALNSLKYFNEKANEYHVVAAGSLLGVKLANSQGFPVGKVSFLDLYPMSFEEFLIANNRSELAKALCTNSLLEPFSEPIHDELIELLKLYTIVGGMPDAVLTYLNNPNNFEQVRKVQKDILDAYELDIAKHAKPHDVIKILKVWHSIPTQLAKENKKFMFSKMDTKARAREYEDAIIWLTNANMIMRSEQITTPQFPLSGHLIPTAFKVFMLDVGLLGCMSLLPPQILLQKHELFSDFKGSFTENLVAQELTCHEIPLYYWSLGQQAEVDFVLALGMNFFPLEVKAGKDRSIKSLKAYNEKFAPPLLLRTSLLNNKKERNLLNIALYQIAQVKRAVEMHTQST